MVNGGAFDKPAQSNKTDTSTKNSKNVANSHIYWLCRYNYDILNIIRPEADIMQQSSSLIIMVMYTLMDSEVITA